MKHTISFLIVGLFVTLAVPVLEALAQPIDVITFHYPPYMNGDGTGIAEQIVVASFKKKGHGVNFITYPRKRAITSFKQGEKDFFLGLPLYFSEDKIGYSEFIYLRTVLLFSKKHHPNLQFNILEDLKGKKIGAAIGASQIPYFQKAGLIVLEVPKGENTVQMLHSGRVDLIYIIDLRAIRLIDTFFPDQREDFGFLEYKQIGGGLIVRKNSLSWNSFKEFEEGLKSIINSNEYLQIFEQHYGSNQVPDSVLVK